MHPIYRFKLEYKDFLKMYIGDLTQIQNYLFLQKQPIEIEVHLEEVLLSTSHAQFPELGMKEFTDKYRNSILQLVTSLIGEVDKEEGREYFKVLLNSSNEFLFELVKSYMTLIDKSADIQRRLLLPIGNKYSPITIVTNSIILNRLGTAPYEFITNRKIPRQEAFPPEEAILPEVQLRDLNVNMIAITENTSNLIEDYAGNKVNLKPFIDFYRSTDMDYKKSIKGKQYLNAISTIALYESTIEKNRQLGWDRSVQSELNLPYFNSKDRNVQADRTGEILRMASNA